MRYKFEGTIRQTVFVVVEAADEEAAIAALEAGHYELDEELKPDYQSFEWNGGEPETDESE